VPLRLTVELMLDQPRVILSNPCEATCRTGWTFPVVSLMIQAWKHTFTGNAKTIQGCGSADENVGELGRSVEQTHVKRFVKDPRQ
jgi:hypothetical protein